jgi:hypothetical protein
MSRYGNDSSIGAILRYQITDAISRLRKGESKAVNLTREALVYLANLLQILSICEYPIKSHSQDLNAGMSVFCLPSIYLPICTEFSVVINSCEDHSAVRVTYLRVRSTIGIYIVLQTIKRSVNPKPYKDQLFWTVHK